MTTTSEPPSPRRTLAADSFVPYFDYNGQLTVAGSVTVLIPGDTRKPLTLAYALGMSEVDATGGIHIHVGTDCRTSAGAHYWNTGSASSIDPWTSKWVSDTSGDATGEVSVLTGYGVDDNRGHIVVIHAADGTKIACGILAAQPANDGAKDNSTGEGIGEGLGMAALVGIIFGGVVFVAIAVFVVCRLTRSPPAPAG